MRPRTSKRTKVRVIFLLLGLSLLAVVLPPQLTGSLGNVVQIFVPLQHTLSKVSPGEAGYAPAASPQMRELSIYKNRAEAFYKRNHDLMEQIRELTAIRDLGVSEGRLIPAQIVAGDSLAWRQSRLVDQGTLKGVKKKAPVTSRVTLLAPEGQGGYEGAVVLAGEVLVGEVVQVGTHTARVLLVTDPQYHKLVRMAHLSGEELQPIAQDYMIRGSGDGFMRISGVDYKLVENQQLAIGDTVFTSEVDDRLPFSLVMGHVHALERDDDNPVLYDVIVKPDVNFARLKRVYIVDHTPDQRMSDTLEFLVIIAAVLLSACVIALMILLWRWRQRSPERGLLELDAQLQSALSESNASARQALTEALAKLQMGLQERISVSNEAVSQAVQKSLQSGRIEQHNVLQRSVQALEARFQALQEQVDEKLHQTLQANRSDLSKVTERLIKLHEATGQIVALSKGVNELHTLLKAPKLRGTFGEWAMEQLLEDVLGQEGHIFKRQYTLSNGVIADAAIFTPGGDQIVCVDAKFPTTQAQMILSDGLAEQERSICERQFARDVLQQARSIAEKYIRPPQTLDFAFMFVPTESIFQLILNHRDLHEKLLRLNVIPTSPNSFYAYLQALAFALRGIKIQEGVVEIQKEVERIARDFDKFARNYSVLGNHVDKVHSKYQETLQDIQRFQSRVSRIRSIKEAQDPPPQPDPR